MEKGRTPFLLLCYRVNAYLLAVALFLELDFAVYKSEQSIVAAAPDVLAGMHFRAALTNKDITDRPHALRRDAVRLNLCRFWSNRRPFCERTTEY